MREPDTDNDPGAERLGALPSVQAAADALLVALSRGDEDRTFAVALEVRDRLRDALPRRANQADEADRADRAEVAAAWAVCPTGLEDRWHVLLAALVHREFEHADLPAPVWTTMPSLTVPWVLDTPRLTEAQIREQTPLWLAARNIYIAVKDLGTL